MTNRFEAMSKSRQAFVLLASVIALVVLMALLAEIGIRIRQAIHYGSAMASGFDALFRIDPATGLRLMVPGLHTSRMSSNSLGLRGPEIPLVKPNGTVRVAFLGGSTTFCAEVSSDAMVWPSLVIDKLRAASPGQAFDFVNAGIPGYSLGSMQRILGKLVAPLKPDVIVIYEGHNDL